jgi:hypothetical protein
MTTAMISVNVSNYRKTGPNTGTLNFALSGPNVDSLGNINLKPIHSSVTLQFNLAIGGGPNGPPNIGWVSPATDAIWLLPGSTGCPTGPSTLPEFGTPTTPASNILKIDDRNTPTPTSQTFLYMLRAVVNDQGVPVTCSHDPMIINRIDDGPPPPPPPHLGGPPGPPPTPHR